MEMGMGMGRTLDAASSMALRTSLDGLVVVAVEDRSWGAPGEGEDEGKGVCLFVFISGLSDREVLLSTGEGGRGTWVGASVSVSVRGIIWPGASGGGVGSSVARSACRTAGGMTSAG